MDQDGRRIADRKNLLGRRKFPSFLARHLLIGFTFSHEGDQRKRGKEREKGARGKFHARYKKQEARSSRGTGHRIERIGNWNENGSERMRRAPGRGKSRGRKTKGANVRKLSENSLAI